jgi:hypothetical protein
MVHQNDNTDMQKKLRSIPIVLLIMIILALALPVDKSFANGAMPYTEDALDKLNAAIAIMRAPNDIQGDGDYRVKTYIYKYREIFASAGYDYEKSIMKIINDIQFDRYKVNKVTIKMNSLARELLRVHVKNNVNPRKYLHKDCAELLIEFRTLIRSNMDKYGGC